MNFTENAILTCRLCVLLNGLLDAAAICDQPNHHPEIRQFPALDHLSVRPDGTVEDRGGEKDRRESGRADLSGQHPDRGAYEVVGFLGAIVIAFALGYTQKRKDHIVVDILTERFPKRVNRILDGINYLITTVFFAIVSWQLFVWGIKISKSGEVSETIKIIFHPFIYCVAVGFVVFSFSLLSIS